MRNGLAPILFGGFNPVAALGSDLVAYWDAARPDKMTLDSSNAVASWRDIKGNYDATQGTGTAQPIWSGGGFNGFPGVTFDGTDDVLTATDAAMLALLPTGSAGSELWGLVQQDAAVGDTAARTAFGYGNTTLQTARRFGRIVGTGAVRGISFTGNNTATDNIIGTRVDLSRRHVIRYQVQAPAGTSVLTVDGIAEGSVASDPSAVGAPNKIRIGARTTSTPAEYWQGKIAVVMVTRPLSGRKAASLTSWLAKRVPL